MKLFHKISPKGLGLNFYAMNGLLDQRSTVYVYLAYAYIPTFLSDSSCLLSRNSKLFLRD